MTRRTPASWAASYMRAVANQVWIGENVPADFDLVAGVGGEVDDDVHTLEDGRQRVRVAEVDLGGVGPVGRFDVDAVDIVVAAEVGRQESSYGTADAGYEDFH